MPSAEALAQAAIHQATGMALMPVLTCGVRKGIYRYATHEAANQASEEAIVQAIALNQRHLQHPRHALFTEGDSRKRPHGQTHSGAGATGKQVIHCHPKVGGFKSEVQRSVLV